MDIGAGVTDIALYRGGNIATGVIPVGGSSDWRSSHGVTGVGALCGRLQIGYGKAQSDPSTPNKIFG